MASQVENDCDKVGEDCYYVGALCGEIGKVGTLQTILVYLPGLVGWGYAYLCSAWMLSGRGWI
jgi:hypothetical protein